MRNIIGKALTLPPAVQICAKLRGNLRYDEDHWPGWKLQLLILPNSSKTRSKTAEMREIIGQSDDDHTILPGGHGTRDPGHTICLLDWPGW